MDSAEGGTRVTITIDYLLGGFFRLAVPIVTRMGRRQLETDFAILKDLLESRT